MVLNMFHQQVLNTKFPFFIMKQYIPITLKNLISMTDAQNSRPKYNLFRYLFCVFVEVFVLNTQ